MIRFPIMYLDSLERDCCAIVTVCQLEGSTYAIFEQGDEWEGNSITNTIVEAIDCYHQWADLLELPEPSDLIYVEHYTGRFDEWDRVTRYLSNNEWEVAWTRLPDDLCRKLAVKLGEGGPRWTMT